MHSGRQDNLAGFRGSNSNCTFAANWQDYADSQQRGDCHRLGVRKGQTGRVQRISGLWNYSEMCRIHHVKSVTSMEESKHQGRVISLNRCATVFGMLITKMKTC